MKIFITGGAGYVGSAVVSAVTDAGHTPVILDSLITGKDEFVHGKIFYMGDIGDTELLGRIFREHDDIEIMIHCAELAAVGQSVTDPYNYYHSNSLKTIDMLNAIKKAGLRKVIFSSTALLYDVIPGFCVSEDSPVKPKSPYARSKFAAEMMIQDFSQAYDMDFIIFRIFNPIGADPILRTGKQPKNADTIISALVRVINGEDEHFVIHGKKWGTRDGTCIRDYIHIWDLARAYIRAIENFDGAIDQNPDGTRCLTLNIGAGLGVTVLEFIYAFENVTGEKISYIFAEPRIGDIAGVYANNERARSLLSWNASLPLEEAIIDSMRWENKKQ